MLVVPTDDSGFYQSGLTPSGTPYTVSVQTPPDTTASPANNPSTTDLLDSDGESDGAGNSVAHFTLPERDTNGDSSTDFGFTATSGYTNPGTAPQAFGRPIPRPGR